MPEIWFTSDTHFFHSNILHFIAQDGERIRREFSSMDEMHEVMVERWNKLVRPEDLIYHLGDVSFRINDDFASLMSRLQGRKRLVVGNHDDLANRDLLKWFERVSLWRTFKDGGFVCTHIPSRLDQLRNGSFNVHGHIHRAHLSDPHYINVSVEVTNYAPVHFDEIRAAVISRRGAKR